MDDKTRLQHIIANGEIILGAVRVSMFSRWYDQAELALEQAFGKDWRDIVLWEDYDPGDERNQNWIYEQQEALGLAL